MKTVFVVNPCAGKHRDIEKLKKEIKLASELSGKEVEIYTTTAEGDATRFVKEYCLHNGNARFIACGGDGTLGEVVNGAMKTEGCEVGVLPMGTGNDFCRNFEVDFSDISAHILGECEPCDVIRYTTFINGEEKSGYCMNMFNIGFDCNVADLTNYIKKKWYLGGSFSYFAAILVTLIRKKGANLKIELDGKKVHNGPLLLSSIANGCYCGGGVKSNPLASIRDGRMNINIIKNVSRTLFVSLLPAYMKGQILEKKRAKKIINSVNCKNIKISPDGGKMRICIDGEITDAGETEFQVIHKGISFVIPKIAVKEAVLV